MKSFFVVTVIEVHLKLAKEKLSFRMQAKLAQWITHFRQYVFTLGTHACSHDCKPIFWLSSMTFSFARINIALCSDAWTEQIFFAILAISVRNHLLNIKSDMFCYRRRTSIADGAEIIWVLLLSYLIVRRRTFALVAQLRARHWRELT